MGFLFRCAFLPVEWRSYFLVRVRVVGAGLAVGDVVDLAAGFAAGGGDPFFETRPLVVAGSLTDDGLAAGSFAAGAAWATTLPPVPFCSTCSSVSTSSSSSLIILPLLSVRGMRAMEATSSPPFMFMTATPCAGRPLCGYCVGEHSDYLTVGRDDHQVVVGVDHAGHTDRAALGV